MFKLIQQKGSSTVGLLTASTIFIGLLVYANQFAFNSNEDSFFSSFFNNTPETATKQPVDTVSSLNTDAIQPSSQGIFETPTLTSQDLNEAESSEQSVESIEQNPAPSTDVAFTANQLVFNENEMTQPYIDNHHIDNHLVNQGYADQAALASYQYQNAGFNNNQQYYSTARANGRGNGRGRMNSDGAFNFSMSFKGRGRMDADSDFDGNMAADGNAYQNHIYNANAVSYPAYSYGYYSY